MSLLPSRSDPAPPLPVARLQSPAQVVAVLPHLLGYRPDEQFIVVGLTGSRRRLGLTMAGPLPSPREEQAQAEDAMARMRGTDAEQALLVVATETPDAGGRAPYRSFVGAVRRAAEDRGIGLVDALLLRAGRWRSFLCPNPECCPPEGNEPAGPYDGPAGQITAAAAAAGVAPLPSRSALVAALAAPTGDRAATLRETLAGAGPPADQATRWPGRRNERRAALAAWRTALAAAEEPPFELTDEQAAGLIRSLDDLLVRDAVATWCLDEDVPVRTLLGTLVRRAVPPWDTAVCTLLAWVAYAAGDGATANVALDRALATDPEYSMARLLRQGLDANVHPQHLRRALLAARDDISRLLGQV